MIKTRLQIRMRTSHLRRRIRILYCIRVLKIRRTRKMTCKRMSMTRIFRLISNRTLRTLLARMRITEIPKRQTTKIKRLKSKPDSLVIKVMPKLQVQVNSMMNLREMRVVLH